MLALFLSLCTICAFAYAFAIHVLAVAVVQVSAVERAGGRQLKNATNSTGQLRTHVCLVYTVCYYMVRCGFTELTLL
jgi:hypothetical protein